MRHSEVFAVWPDRLLATVRICISNAGQSQLVSDFETRKRWVEIVQSLILGFEFCLANLSNRNTAILNPNPEINFNPIPSEPQPFQNDENKETFSLLLRLK